MSELDPVSRPRPESPARGGGFRLADWWPALAMAALAVACVGLLAVQHAELGRLRVQVAELEQERQARAAEAAAAAARQQTAAAAEVPGAREDLERLRATVQQLNGEIARLTALQAENQKLQQRAAANAPGLSPEEVQPMVEARARARSIACINNLKQLGLAARIWATDNGDVLPPDFLSMSNEISAPKILVCPEDEGRQAAPNWGSFTLANTSYEYLAASGSETEPTRVAFRCPIHGHVGLCDGSVQGSVAKNQPERLVMRDGKLFLDNVAVMGTQLSEEMKARYGLGTGQTVIQMDPRMAARYGLPTGTVTAVEGQPMSEELMRRYGLQPPDDPGEFVPDAPEPEPAP